jgi:hypothetical protein
VIQHLFIGKPQNPNAMHVEILCAGVIVDDLVGICMDATIDFDFDLVLDTKGIKDEWTVWMLPTEFQAS